MYDSDDSDREDSFDELYAQGTGQGSPLKEEPPPPPPMVEGKTCYLIPVLDKALFKTALGSVNQKYWKASKFKEGDYFVTYGLGSCTAFAMCDLTNKVGALAHFDGSQETADIVKMIQGMQKKGAASAKFAFALAGSNQNQSCDSVWVSIQEAIKEEDCDVLNIPEFTKSSRGDWPKVGTFSPATFLCGGWATLILTSNGFFTAEADGDIS